MTDGCFRLLEKSQIWMMDEVSDELCASGKFLPKFSYKLSKCTVLFFFLNLKKLLEFLRGGRMTAYIYTIILPYIYTEERFGWPNQNVSKAVIIPKILLRTTNFLVQLTKFDWPNQKIWSTWTPIFGLVDLVGLAEPKSWFNLDSQFFCSADKIWLAEPKNWFNLDN